MTLTFKNDANGDKLKRN